MDPSAWMEYTSAAQQAYSHLRGGGGGGAGGVVPPGNSQINTASHPPHQYPHHNRNLPPLNHVTSFNSNVVATCQKGASVAKSGGSCPKQHGPHAQMPPANSNVSSYHPGHHHHQQQQSTMNGHYNAASNGSPWFFNSRQQHANQDSSLQVRNHPERGNPSFTNGTHFGLHPHNGVYDSASFMSAQYHQQHQSKSNYLPSMAAASGFMSNMKKPSTAAAAAAADAEMNFRNTYCPPMKTAINMAGMSAAHCPNTLRDHNSLSASSFFSQHPLSSAGAAANGWTHHHHHQNLIPQNNAPNNGMLPHETVNMMTSQNSAPSTSLPREYNRSSCATANPVAGNSLNGFCSKAVAVGCNAKSSGAAANAASSVTQLRNSGHTGNQGPSYKSQATGPAAPFASAMPLSTNNSYLMQNFSSNRSGQNSFVDPTLGAKFAAAAAHHQVASENASLAFAAAAMYSEYASYQQQAQKQHQQYMSSMNNFGANAMNASNSHSSDAYSMPFDSANFNGNRHSNGFMNYCSAPLFPMAHSDTSMNHHANIKSHPGALLDDFNYATTANGHHHHHQHLQQQQQQTNVLNSATPCSTTTKASTSQKSASSQKRSQSQSQQQPPSYCKSDPTVNSLNVNASFNEQFSVSSVGCSNLLGGNAGSANCMQSNGSSNGQVNVARSSVSRCSSVASTSNHPVQQHSNDSYSYNYSPATTNISAHSPYQQRSSTSNSSHSSGASCAMSNGDYLNYGTPNSGPTVFPTMGTSQTPTPTPGYPTPPSSVGHSNSRCNSNEELSPYSSNSMSSSISQSYSRNDFKSSASSSSQISPKQLDTSIPDSMPQFNAACMVASQKNGADTMSGTQSKQHLLAAANMFDASNPLDDSYKTQQFAVSYGNHLSSSAPASTCSNDLYLANYNSSENTSMPAMSHQDTLVNDGAAAMENSNGYDYHHYDAEHEANGQFVDGAYSEDKEELPSCAQQVSKSTSARQPNAHIVESIEQPKGAVDYANDPEHESFNLNFDSVIQPIEVNLSSEQQQPQPQHQQQPDPIEEQMRAGTNHTGDMNLSNMNGSSLSANNSNTSKSQAFPSIDDLSFIAHSEADNQHCPMVEQHQQPESSTAMEHCSPIEFQSSHGNGHLLEGTVMECNNIQSIIDSLPKSDDECMSTSKNDDPSELLSQCSTSDNFLSDLAPLMNDNSKIALMESTFKSNSISAIDKDLDIGSAPFEKINKDIFGDEQNDLKVDHVSMDTYAKHDSEPDNQLKDVDDFLESNLKDVQQQPVTEPLPKSNLDATIDSVARQAAQYDSMDEDDAEIKVSLKVASKTLSAGSRKSSESKKCSKELGGAEAANKNIGNSSNSQSKFFKRKTSDSPLGNSGSGSNKKRKVAVVMPKSKECKKATGTSEYDFFECQAVKPKKSAKKSPSLEAKAPSKRPVKVQLKKEESSQDSCTKEVTLMHVSVSAGPPLPPAQAVPLEVIKKTPQCKKSVAEIAPSCGIQVISPPVKMADSPKVDKLVVNSNSQKCDKSFALVDTSPNSLSETKENVGVNTGTVAKKSKHSSSSSKSKTEKNSSDSASKRVADKQKSLNSSKSVKPKPSSANKSVPKSAIVATTTSSTSISSSSTSTSTNTSTNTNTSTSTSISSSSIGSVASSKVPLPPAIVSTNSSTLLSQASLINATCLSKPVTSANAFNLTPSTNATLSNVAPTLIVNQIENHQPVSSYVSPSLTNAVLISIHPANTTPISSLTAPFITLNTPNHVSSNGTGNSSATNSCNSQSSSSRRRSQDKKVATIREGHMRTGDFVVSEEEAHLELPVIWRIEGKSLLQRFEPSEQNGVTVYTNTSSYSAWNPTVRQKYLGLDVRIMGCNRTRIVVQKLGLTQAKGNESSITSVSEKDISSSTSESPSPLDISQYMESFEVEIQTLISQALDSNFIAEIIKEKDEYFLTHIQTIEDLCNKRRAHFISVVKWDTNIVKYIETYPEIQIHEQNNVGDLRCRLCHDNWSTKILHFDGKMYNFETLEPLPSQPESKQTKLASCELCTERTFLYSRLHHQKYGFLQKCKSKVSEIYSQDEDKESHMVLEECLRDVDWTRKLFSELESLFVSCDNLR